MEFWKNALVMGLVATAMIDLWSMVRKRLLGTPCPNYGLVGRWLGHMPSGRFRHKSIAAAPVVPCERLIGWIAHYLIGIAFASVLLGLWGLDWVRRPTLTPALLIGIGTVVMPFFVMQPGMGAGIAASRTPRPYVARVQSLVTHTLFGIGLYIGGWFSHVLLMV